MTTATPTQRTPDTVAAALAAHPGATAAELAEVAGIGRSTAAKRLAALEQEGSARRAPGGRDDGRRLPDRWHPADGEDTTGTDPVADDPATSEVVAAGESGTTASPSGHATRGGTEPAAAGARLGKGGLRSLVLDYVAGHAGPAGLSPTEPGIIAADATWGSLAAVG